MASVESSDAIRCRGASIRDEDAAVVHEEIGRLPERYRRVVVLCHFEGLTHADAAPAVGMCPWDGLLARVASAASCFAPGSVAVA